MIAEPLFYAAAIPAVTLMGLAKGGFAGLGLGADALRAASPALVVARLSPFGDEGPWADYKASDLVHRLRVSPDGFHVSHIDIGELNTG